MTRFESTRIAGFLLGMLSVGCKGTGKLGTDAGIADAAASAELVAPISSVHVEHGELDNRAPSGAPELAAIQIAAT
ncbi:MAG TPA: hypothetical protein VIV60_35945, partial [Polyangiaceae bacterium]